MLKDTRSRFTSILLAFIMIFTLTAPYAADAEVLGQSNSPQGYELEDGMTAPIYSYEDAIKETIYIASEMDSDRDGEMDLIAADIMRPKETEDGLQVPVIMDASPYYEAMGRGNESEIKDPDGDGINEFFPLYYDNYFVPRGYAVVLPDMTGTNNSDGCPTTGGWEETEGVKVVIDWLNGKGTAWDSDGNEIEADWSTGKVGMVGKSYDGTLPNAAAAQGIEGLETIVPIGAISNWYHYYRYGGIPFYYNGPSGLSQRVTASDNVEQCAPVREDMRVAADDATGNYNDFWAERDFVKDADQVEASVFVIHGINDYNVKANHFSDWWLELAENDVPRKLWISQTGHVEPFDFRRAEWVETLNRWFDYWLLDIDNGIMDEPTVDIEHGKDDWETYSAWPDEDMEEVKVRLAPSDELPGTLATSPVLGEFTQSFTDDPRQRDEQMVEDEFTDKDNRLIFLSPELEEDVRLSGVPELDISAAIDAESTHLTAMIVDYGTDERIDHRSRGEGIRTLDTVSCWGESSEVDDGCYRDTEIITHEADYEIVTHGWLDAKNRESLEYEVPLVPGEKYSFEWETLPEDYIFKEGHRIGIVIAGSANRWTVPDQNRATFDVFLGESNISLPIVGGKEALDDALGYQGGSLPENAAEMKEIVHHYQEEGAFSNQGAYRSINAHLTAVERFESRGDMEKAVRHMTNLEHLLEAHKDRMSQEAYQVLTADMEYLLETWQ
ncbi:Xaa-Pro dipeptidyl-peptidase [Virgibacillus sp. YIM 98842]|jgi:X-Pro dipeptidyl-peptidase|uniref:Xaa-Pro dipeptidyl-peptidase n=1 Tax=Virgibacillus sp. YIM 98842 TaxID=2663533 RepID=UPI0013DB7631|nr:Xaa-Pro dipeptidyl-peptidase [Virgibacillus sp. YIM 98842]